MLLLAPVPRLTGFVAYWIHRSLNDDHNTAPFLLSIVLFLLGILGLAISLFPDLVPPSVTVWQAANTVLARGCSRWSATPSPCRSPSRTRPTPITCSAAKSPRKSRAAGTADAARPRVGQGVRAARLVRGLLCRQPRPVRGLGLRAESDHSALKRL